MNRITLTMLASLPLLASSSTWAADPRGQQAKPLPEHAQATDARFESLFNGRDFQGWRHRGNWAVADGAVYCSRVEKSDQVVPTDLHYIAKKIPGDCDIVFEWKEAGDSQCGGSGSFALGFGVNPHPGVSPAGAGISYQASHLEIRLRTHSVDDPSPADDGVGGAGVDFSSPGREFSKPTGQWNRSRILCKGPRIQFWLNGTKLYDIDMAKARHPKNERNDLTDRAIDDWLARKPSGLYLNVMAPRSHDDIDDPRVLIRSIKVRPLPAAEQLSSEPTESPTVANGTADADDWDWKSHPLFGKLAIPLSEFPDGNIQMWQDFEWRFASLIPEPNIGGWSGPKAVAESALVHVDTQLGVVPVKDCDIKAAFFVVYQEKECDYSRIEVTAWQLASNKNSQSLRDYLVKLAGKDNPRYRVWLVGAHVVLFDPNDAVSAACRAVFERKIGEVIEKFQKERKN
jgi:hypothetical protein